MPSRSTSLKQVPGITVVEEENVPETDAVSQVDGVDDQSRRRNLILATSFGYYTPFVVDMAKKYPDVQFRHAAPLWNKDTDPKNAGSYFPYLNQAHYVNGVAAGLSTKTTRSASSPPSRSRRCSPTSTRCCSAPGASIPTPRCR